MLFIKKKDSSRPEQARTPPPSDVAAELVIPDDKADTGGDGLFKRKLKNVSDAEISGRVEGDAAEHKAAGLTIRKKSTPQPAEPSATSAPSPAAESLSTLASRLKGASAEPAKKVATTKPRKTGALLGNLFKRKKASAEEVPAQTVPELAEQVAPAGKKSMASVLKAGLAAARKPESAKPRESKSSSRTKKAAPAPKSAANSVDVLVELDGDRRVYWRVSRDGLEQVPESAVARAVSFARTDYRYLTEGPLRYGEAMDLALSELGEDCRIVNASKAHRAVYAAVAQRIDGIPAMVAPGLHMLEQLLAKSGHAAEDLIVGLLLEGSETQQSLAILYHIAPNGVSTPPQVTVNPDNLQFTLSQFAASRRLDPDKAQIVLFKNADVLGFGGHNVCYPQETVWHGISVRRLLWAMVFASAVGATGSAGFAAQAYIRVKALENTGTRLAADLKKVDENLQKTISSSLVSFSGTQSLDTKKVSERAGLSWEPGTRVTLEATAAKEQYRVFMPLVRGRFASNRPSVLNQLDAKDVDPLINKVPPEGCTKDIPGVSGGIDAIQISINCESHAGPLSRYWLD